MGLAPSHPLRSSSNSSSISNLFAAHFTRYSRRNFRRYVYLASSDKSYQTEQAQLNSQVGLATSSNSPPSTKREKEKFRSITEALARTFHNMQTNDISCTTGTLTKSFNWDSNDAYTQHDLHELSRMLLDQVEGRIAETPYKGVLDKLFQGKQRSYIECKEVQYTSSRTEVFSDIQLDVKDCDNLKDSFAKYVETETLDGDNQYDTDEGGFGKQDAIKGINFESFPPILSLHLKRFEFDFSTLQKSKINDRLEFPLELCLSDYLQKKPSTDAEATYHLYSIIVHEGGINHGHYYTYIRPKLSSYNQDDPNRREWFKFNDDVVSLVDSEQEMLDSVYGPTADSISPRPPTAYVLTYIRNSDLEEVLGDVKKSGQEDPPIIEPPATSYGKNSPNDDDIPPEFTDLLEEIKNRSKMLRQLNIRNKSRVQVKLVTDAAFADFDLKDGRVYSPCEVERICRNGDKDSNSVQSEKMIMRNYLFDLEDATSIDAQLSDFGWEIIRKAALEFKIPTYCIRLWRLGRITSNSIALTVQSLIDPDDLDLTVGTLIAGNDGFPFFYLEVLSKHTSEYPLKPKCQAQNIESLMACPPKSSVRISDTDNIDDIVPKCIADTLKECSDFNWKEDPLGLKLNSQSLGLVQEACSPLQHEDSGNVVELIESIVFIKQFQAQRNEAGEIINATTPLRPDACPIHFLGKVIIRTINDPADAKKNDKRVKIDFAQDVDDEEISNLKRVVNFLSTHCADTLGSAGVIDTDSSKFWAYNLAPPRRKNQGVARQAVRAKYPLAPENNKAMHFGTLLVFQDGRLVDESDNTANVTIFSDPKDWEGRRSKQMMSLNYWMFNKNQVVRRKVTMLPLTAADASYLSKEVGSGSGVFSNLKREIFGMFDYGREDENIERFLRKVVQDNFGGEDGCLGEEGWTRLRLVKLNVDDFNGGLRLEKPEPDVEALKLLDSTDHKDELATAANAFFRIEPGNKMCYVGNQSLERMYCYFHVSPFTKSEVERIEHSPSLPSPHRFYSTTVIAASTDLRNMWEQYDHHSAARSPKFWLPLVEKAVIIHEDSGVEEIAEEFSSAFGDSEQRESILRRTRIFHVAQGRIRNNPGRRIGDSVRLKTTEKLVPLGAIQDDEKGGKEWNKYGLKGCFDEHKFLAEIVSEEEEEMWRVEFGEEGKGSRAEGKNATVVPVQVLFLAEDNPPLAVALPVLTFLRWHEGAEYIKRRVLERLGNHSDLESILDGPFHIVPHRENSRVWVGEKDRSSDDLDDEPEQSQLWTHLKEHFGGMFGRSSGEKYWNLARRAYQEGESADFEEYQCPTVGFMLKAYQLDKLKRARTHLCLGSAGLEFDEDGICVERERGDEDTSANRNRGGIQFKDRRKRAFSIDSTL